MSRVKQLRSACAVAAEKRRRETCGGRVVKETSRRGQELWTDTLLPRLRAPSYQRARLDRRHYVCSRKGSLPLSVLLLGRRRSSPPCSLSRLKMATRLASRSLLSRFPALATRQGRLYLPSASRCMASVSGDAVRLQQRAGVRQQLVERVRAAQENTPVRLPSR